MNEWWVVDPSISQSVSNQSINGWKEEALLTRQVTHSLTHRLIHQCMRPSIRLCVRAISPSLSVCVM